MMAHAIDIARADDRPTIRSRSAGALGARSCGCGAPRARHSAAGRRLQLRHDRHDDRLQLADDRVVEATVRDGRPRRLGRPSSWLEAERPDAGPRSAHHGVDASPTTARDRKSTRLNSSHSQISYAVLCLKKKINKVPATPIITQ